LQLPAQGLAVSAQSTNFPSAGLVLLPQVHDLLLSLPQSLLDLGHLVLVDPVLRFEIKHFLGLQVRLPQQKLSPVQRAADRVVPVRNQRHLLLPLLPVSQLLVLRRHHLVLRHRRAQLDPRGRQLAVTSTVHLHLFIFLQPIPTQLPQSHPKADPRISVVALLDAVRQNLAVSAVIENICQIYMSLAHLDKPALSAKFQQHRRPPLRVPAPSISDDISGLFLELRLKDQFPIL